MSNIQLPVPVLLWDPLSWPVDTLGFYGTFSIVSLHSASKWKASQKILHFWERNMWKLRHRDHGSQQNLNMAQNQRCNNGTVQTKYFSIPWVKHHWTRLPRILPFSCAAHTQVKYLWYDWNVYVQVKTLSLRYLHSDCIIQTHYCLA